MCSLSVGQNIHVTFSTNGKFVVAWSDDGLVKIWNAENGTEVSRMDGALCQAGKGVECSGGKAAVLRVGAL